MHNIADAGGDGAATAASTVSAFIGPPLSAETVLQHSVEEEQERQQQQQQASGSVPLPRRQLLTPMHLLAVEIYLVVLLRHLHNKQRLLALAPFKNQRQLVVVIMEVALVKQIQAGLTIMR